MEPFADSILFAHGAPRPNRVYSLEELLILDDGDAAREQRAALARAGIAHARFIRIPAPADHTVWLFLMHDRRDFGAADSALLSALAPHVALALGLLLETDSLRLRAAAAEDALALIGVGQAAFDADGRVIAADAIAADELDVQPSGRPQLRAREAQSLNEACADMAGASPRQRQVVRLDERAAKDMLLRPAPAIAGATAIGLLRQPRREDEAGAARVITSTLGLSAREAALAEAMSRGRTILTAGAELQLTPETARNYSKRIYAKTGARGQADLVRFIHRSVLAIA
jgi:DNA-binding CsgD family transcriptional regulator